MSDIEVRLQAKISKLEHRNQNLKDSLFQSMNFIAELEIAIDNSGADEAVYSFLKDTEFNLKEAIKLVGSVGIKNE